MKQADLWMGQTVKVRYNGSIFLAKVKSVGTAPLSGNPDSNAKWSYGTTVEFLEGYMKGKTEVLHGKQILCVWTTEMQTQLEEKSVATLRKMLAEEEERLILEDRKAVIDVIIEALNSIDIRASIASHRDKDQKMTATLVVHDIEDFKTKLLDPYLAQELLG